MNPYLFRALDFGPDLLAWHVNRIDPARWDERLDPDRFSPREVIAHMADWEPILRSRIQTGIDAPGSTVIGLDEWERGKEVGYGFADVKTSVDTFRKERAKTIDLLQSISSAEWANTFEHSELGTVSVYDYANTMACHDVYHMEQLTHY